MSLSSSRTVAALRPRPALAVEPSSSVAGAAARMREKNADAAIVVDAAGELLGIITDTDIARVLAEGGDPSVETVEVTMTASPRSAPPPNPTDITTTTSHPHHDLARPRPKPTYPTRCVRSTDAAVDALGALRTPRCCGC